MPYSLDEHKAIMDDLVRTNSMTQTTDEKAELVARLRATRANMLGTPDEPHYHDCHEAADAIDALRAELAQARAAAIEDAALRENLLLGWLSWCVRRLEPGLGAYVEKAVPEVRALALPARDRKTAE